MVLLVILITGDVFEQVIPVTAPPVPVDDKLLMVFEATFRGLAVLAEEPMVMPVTVLWPVRFVIVLLERLEAPFQ